MTQPTYQVTEPRDGEVLETFPFATDAEIERAMAAAAQRLRGVGARARWRSGSRSRRGSAALFAERAEELARHRHDGDGQVGGGGRRARRSSAPTSSTTTPTTARSSSHPEPVPGNDDGPGGVPARSARSSESCRGTTPTTRSPASRRRT